MASVQIAELKNHLSAYLRKVRTGEEVVICDRKTPIAQIVPLKTSRKSQSSNSIACPCEPETRCN